MGGQAPEVHVKGNRPQGLAGDSETHCTKTSATYRFQVHCWADCANLQFPCCTWYRDEGQVTHWGQNRSASQLLSFILIVKHLYNGARTQCSLCVGWNSYNAHWLISRAPVLRHACGTCDLVSELDPFPLPYWAPSWVRPDLGTGPGAVEHGH